MWASLVFYWEHFWKALYLAVTVYFTQPYSWLEIAGWVWMNYSMGSALSKAERQRNGWQDPNLIYSPVLDDYVPLSRYEEAQNPGEWRHSYEDIPPEKRTWFHKAMIWLGLDPSK